MAEYQEKSVDNFDELFPGNYIKSGDVANKPTYTIKRATLRLVEGNKGDGAVLKGNVYLEEEQRTWLLNRTNGECLKAMFGKSLKGWEGKRVTLFEGVFEEQPCIRVWGSPDIPADTSITLALGRKRPFKMLMHKTGASKAAAPAAPETMSERYDELTKLIVGCQSETLLGAIGAEIAEDLAQESITPNEATALKKVYKQRLLKLKGESSDAIK
jgi:hypothetical protein